MALVGKLFNQISARGRMRGVEVVQPLRVVKRKSVVMTGGKGNIFTTRVFRRGDKIFRPVLLYLELIYKGVIFVYIRIRVARKIPLAFAYLAIKSEVYEHAENELRKTF